MKPSNDEAEGSFAPLQKVTPLSKYLALTLFIIMPFIGGWIGYTFAPEKVVEVERVVIQEIEVEEKVDVQEAIMPSNESVSQCEVDSDCALVSPDCEDCQFVAIGTNEVNKFREEKRNRCELNPPQIMCDLVFTGGVKCLDNSCQIVE